MSYRYMLLIALIFVFANIKIQGEELQLPEDHYVSMPGGKMKKECVFNMDEEFSFKKGMIHTASGKSILTTGDGLDTLCGNNNKMGNSSIATARRKLQNLEYYSGWISYAGYAHREGEFDSFSSVWTVPPPPPDTRRYSHLFIFNGIQDKAHQDSTMILQPVLQYGSSGCGGGEYWALQTYLVLDNGRAYCGKMIKVSEGDQINGTMVKTADKMWDVIGITASGKESRYSTELLDSAGPLNWSTCAMEAQVVYSCGAYPGGNDGTLFSNNVIMASGKKITPIWESTVKHNECNQGIQINQENSDVLITYDSSL